MKLLFLGTGASIHMYKWVRFFADRGHETTWLSMTPSMFERMDGIRFEQIGGRGPGPVRLVRAAIEARRLIREARPDVVHAHYLGAYGMIGVFAGWHPLVGTAWGSDILFAGRSIVKRPFVRHVVRSSDVLTCDAEHMIRAMAKLGVDERKVRLIYFGIDTERFRPAEPDQALRAKVGVHDAPTVISLRRLEPVYDLPTLLRAAVLVLKDVPSTKFVIVGTGSEEGALKSLAGSLGISGSVLFLGAVPNEELPRYLTSMDVYVSTSLSDAGIAASTAEAMACGVPVVITDSGENEKWVESGVSGFVTPVRDASAMAQKLSLLLADAELRLSVGRAGRRVIEERNSYHGEMMRMERVYEEVGHPG